MSLVKHDPTRVTFDYRREVAPDIDSDEWMILLEYLGADGWELVNIITITQPPVWIPEQFAFFKRQHLGWQRDG